MGVPTVEEYEADKAYWREMATQHHLNELERIESSKKDNVNKVSYTEIQCNGCGNNNNKVAKFQTGYGYDCYAGLWTCHAYAPTWVYLSDGESNKQTLTVANNHNWIDPFWLVGGNQRMNITYTYQHTSYDDGHRILSDASKTGGDVQLINTAKDVDTVSKINRIDNPRANYSLDTFWYVNTIS